MKSLSENQYKKDNHYNNGGVIITENAYIHAATSENTRIAYQTDIDHFLKEGGALPATPEQVEMYLKKCASLYNPRTLIRRMTALRQWHRLANEKDPTTDSLVTKTLKGITRLHGRPRKQASALRLKELDQVVAHLDQSNNLISVRNKAMMLLGFFGAFRRSELVSLTWEQIEFVSDGMLVTLPRSKTDQAGEGAKCVIPFGNERRCPVRALITWRKESGVWEGPIFRRISKTGNLLKKEITSKHFNYLVKKIAEEVGLPNPEGYSSHSLRRGFATESARLGASMPAIQKHGRWRSTKTVIEYIEAGRQFADSAVNVLFEF